MWQEIDNRMQENAPKFIETADAFKKRLRRTALRLPKTVVRKAVLAIPKRIKQVIKAKGKSIPRD